MKDEQEPMTCEQARATLHELLDGDSGRSGTRASIPGSSSRLAPSCREADRDLQTIQDRVARSSACRLCPTPRSNESGAIRLARRAGKSRGVDSRGMDWRPAAAAAALAAVLLGVHFVGPPDPSEAELNQAAVEARMVLQC